MISKTRITTAILTVFLLWLPADGAVRADELIRVALVSDVPSVMVSGSPTLVITTPDGAPVAAGLKSPVEFLPGPRGLVLQGRSTGLRELVVSSPGGDVHLNEWTVGGVVHIAYDRDKLRLINELDVEEYLKGVVPLEISPNWNPEVLKVQAIIARTYVLHQRQVNLGKEYDVLATTADQVYGGRSNENPTANRAIAESKGLVVTYDGELILSAYHSTAAGPTESALEVWGIDLPYLKGVSCPLDQNSPYYHWRKSFPMDAVQALFAKAGYDVGTIASATPFRWTQAGRISRIRLLHSRGELILKAEDLRRIMGYAKLPSTHFHIEKMGREIQIQGNGYGHGVGLCQWGAKVMSEMGYRYEKILKYYYPGVRVETYPPVAAGPHNP